ncbi:unnamed protein product, partial [Ceratitis capitata]
MKIAKKKQKQQQGKKYNNNNSNQRNGKHNVRITKNETTQRVKKELQQQQQHNSLRDSACAYRGARLGIRLPAFTQPDNVALGGTYTHTHTPIVVKHPMNV